MGSRFEKFSERARRVLSLAQEEAQRFNHNYIGTEHILLDWCAKPRALRRAVLSSLTVDLTKVRSAVEFIIGRGEKPPQGEIGLTPRAKKSGRAGRGRSPPHDPHLHRHRASAHRTDAGRGRRGSGVLESLGVTLDKVRAETHRILSHSSGGGTSGGRTSTKTPTLDQLGVDLTKAARAEKLDQVIGPRARNSAGRPDS